MKRSDIPVYNISAIDRYACEDLLIERFGSYLEKHYHDLHNPHRHSFYHLVMFTKGKGFHTIDFKKFTVKPYQLYFMAPGQVHSWHFVDGVDGYVVHFNEVLFTGFLQDSHYLERFYFFRGTVEDSVCQLPRREHKHVIELFESMLNAANESVEKNLDLIRLRLLELFITVNSSTAGNHSKNAAPQKLVLLRNFQQLIDRNFRTIRLPKDYAQLLYITPDHLNALTRDLLGKTAGHLIRDRVLLEAKRLLTNADMSISEIAYDLNFKDNSYFNRFFKKYEKITPDEFRRSFSKGT
jgi:AraC family transcriptional activator of pobA